jgi:hypothetical protein
MGLVATFSPSTVTVPDTCARRKVPFCDSLSLAEHIAWARSQQVLSKHLLGKGHRVLPGAGLESRI